MKKKLFGILAVTLAFTTFAACGSSKYTSDAVYDGKSYSSVNSMAESAAYDEGYYDYTEESYDSSYSDTEAGTYNDSARKLIKTYNIDIETEHFSEMMSFVDRTVNELHGYIESESTYNGSNGYDRRNSSLTIRIPKANVEVFIQKVGNEGNITRENLSVEDVTLQYVDTESKKASYEIEQQRLLDLLDKAESIEDILTIEERLSVVRYQLESMGSQLRTYDNLVDYATVYLYIDEVKAYTPPVPETYGDRLANAFVDSVESVFEGLKNFLVWLIGAIPVILILAVVGLIIFFIVRAIIRSDKKRNEKKKAKLQNTVSTVPLNTTGQQGVPPMVTPPEK